MPKTPRSPAVSPGTLVAAPANLSSFKCPALVGIDENGGAIVPFFVRPLNPADVKALRKHTQTAIQNRKRFQLFLIVKKNSAAWLRYTLALLRPIDGLSEDEQVELDRLLMNFLSSARSLIDHFSQYHMQTFRKTADETKYKEYLAKLETNSWAFAFFQDLRNFTQHCGLPIGNFSRHSSRYTVKLKIISDAKWLLEHSNPERDWKKSKLKKSHGKLDLIELTQEYHARLLQDLGGFVAKAFGPSIIEAHNFFAALAQEVQAACPGKSMAIATKYLVENNQIHAQLKQPPADLFKDLGITVAQIPQQKG
jgi:hypothetical protein